MGEKINRMHDKSVDGWRFSDQKFESGKIYGLVREHGLNVSFVLKMMRQMLGNLIND